MPADPAGLTEGPTAARTGADPARLIARHLRLHAALLALRAQAQDLPPAATPQDWLRWLARRDALLQRIAELNPAQLASDSAPATAPPAPPNPLQALLRTLCERELALLQHAADDHHRLQTAARAHRRALLHNLRRAHAARTATRRYHPPKPPTKRPRAHA